MGSLLFRCPNSGQEFESGVHTDIASLDLVRDLLVKLWCPICNEVHELTIKRGKLAGDIGAAPDHGNVT